MIANQQAFEGDKGCGQHIELSFLVAESIVPLPTKRLLAILLFVLAYSSSTLNAYAGLLTPNGNPTGDAYAYSPTYWTPLPGYYTVALDPADARYLEVSPTKAPSEWLVKALDAQGYNSANGWTITYFELEGDYRLDTYTAYTEVRPLVGNHPAESTPGAGGAILELTFIPKGSDPSGYGADYANGTGAHWIQVIRTNIPSSTSVGTEGGGDSYIEDPGFTWYLDNNGNSANSPFYDALYIANPTYFLDWPRRPYSNDTVWQAEVYIATGDLANKKLQISYNGVFWGFNDPFHISSVPEPSTFVLDINRWRPIVNPALATEATASGGVGQSASAGLSAIPHFQRSSRTKYGNE